LDVVGCGGVDSGEAAFRHFFECTSRDGGSALLTQGVGVLEKIETVGGNH
jgi:dihydroorotate dehydrogenase